MTRSALNTPGLEAVGDADREWFVAHPQRRYRLRRLTLAEVLPGQCVVAGMHVVVVKLGTPLARMRLPVGRPPAQLRNDTDRCCAALVARCHFEISGKPVSELVPKVQASFAE